MPVHDGLGDLLDAGKSPIRGAEVVHQRAVEEMPRTTIEDLGHTVGSDGPAAGVETDVSGELLDVR